VPDGVVGPAALAALIVETHEALPGFRVWATSAPRMLAERMAITWAGEGGDPPIPQAGTDVIESALTAGSPASRTCSTSTDQAGGDSPASSRAPGASPQLLS
jgi:hypothetical protein